jgi:hypothetical protein
VISTPQRSNERSRLELTLSPAALVVSDVLAIAAGFWLAYYVRFVLEFPAAEEIHSARAYSGLLLLSTPILLISFVGHGLYERRNLLRGAPGSRPAR